MLESFKKIVSDFREYADKLSKHSGSKQLNDSEPWSANHNNQLGPSPPKKNSEDTFRLSNSQMVDPNINTTPHH